MKFNTIVINHKIFLDICTLESVHSAIRVHSPLSLSLTQFSSIFIHRRISDRRRGDPREIHVRVSTRWTNADRTQARDTSPVGGGLARQERKGERETPTQVGPHTTVPSFVGHCMGMSCSTDTRYTALYTSWRCPAACRIASGPCNFMAEADCVRLE